VTRDIFAFIDFDVVVTASSAASGVRRRKRSLITDYSAVYRLVVPKDRYGMMAMERTKPKLQHADRLQSSAEPQAVTSD